MEASNNIPAEEPTLEYFRPPEGKEARVEEGLAQAVDISSIVSIATNEFVFQESSGTPGRFLEQAVAVTRPPNAGFFTLMTKVSHAFMTPDLQFLTERPLGQVFAQVGMRGDNLVCTVRLTDSNADDPIRIRVTAHVLFFQ
jgi:hypothetical protein